MTFTQILAFTLSMIFTVLFFLYGFNHYYLLFATRRYKKPVLPNNPEYHPKVSIHLPVYNERYVVRRLIDASVAAVEAYGTADASVRVLDDSTDDTKDLIDEIVSGYQKKGVNIDVVRREKRTGYKAGALQHALEISEAEFIAIFDADFVPPEDFLLRTVPYFGEDDTLAIVQSRWGHLNRDFNMLTKAIAIGIDVHFLIEQTGRYAANCCQNFNGTGGVIRKSAIQEAGGWQADTLAEDLDLSYRIQSRCGYHVIFLNDLVSPAEIPPTVPSFKRQQARWACGSLRTAKKLLPEVMRNKNFNFKQKLQAFIHLTGYMLHPLMLGSFLLICFTTIFNVGNFGWIDPSALELVGDYQDLAKASPGVVLDYIGAIILFVTIVFCSIAPWISMIVALKSQGLSVRKNIVNLIVQFLLGFGVSLSNTIEAGKALLTNRVWAFVRTPKYAEVQGGQGWQKKRYQVNLDSTWVLEFLLVVLGCTAIYFCIRYKNLISLGLLILYTVAFFFVFALSWKQSIKVKKSLVLKESEV